MSNQTTSPFNEPPSPPLLSPQVVAEVIEIIERMRQASDTVGGENVGADLLYLCVNQRNSLDIMIRNWINGGNRYYAKIVLTQIDGNKWQIDSAHYQVYEMVLNTEMMRSMTEQTLSEDLNWVIAKLRQRDRHTRSSKK